MDFAAKMPQRYAFNLTYKRKEKEKIAKTFADSKKCRTFATKLMTTN